MGRSIFKFKQFVIEQDRCAMKVGTDGVLIGAWTNVENRLNALDIGTGTGLISLMLAQRGVADVRAVEIDKLAAAQASDNVAVSKFANQIKVYPLSLDGYSKICDIKYDLIISNPPFFQKAFLSNIHTKNIARHAIALTYIDIFNFAVSFLNSKGVLSLIFPFELKQAVISMAENSGLYPLRIMDVYSNKKKPAVRSMLEFSFERKEIFEDSLFIENENRHDYSDEYVKLTKDFYLYIDKT